MKDLLKDQPLWEKLLKKGFWLYFFSYVTIPAWYLVRIIISNSITVEEVGILYSIISFVWLVSIYNDLGLTDSLQYFIPKFWIKKQYDFIKTSIISSLTVQIITTLFIVSILRFVAPRLANNYFHSEYSIKILRFFCLYFLGINIFQVISSVYLSFQDTFNRQLINFIRQWGVLIFVLIFFLLDMGNIYNYWISWIIALFLAIFISIFIFWRRYKDIFVETKFNYNKKVAKKYLKYALWVFLWANASMLLSQIDQQMVIMILGAKSAWYYANYLSLFSISAMIIGPIIALIFPLVSEISAKKDEKKMMLLQNFIYTYLSILSISVGVFLALFGKEISVVLYWAKFINSWYLLTFWWGFAFLYILSATSLSVITGLWLVKHKVKIVAVVGVLNVLMNLIFMKFRWLYWVILSTVIGRILIILLSIRKINASIPIKIDRSFVLKNIFAILLLSVLIYFLKWNIFELQDQFRRSNLIFITIFLFCYYFIIWLINFKTIISLKNTIKTVLRN